MSATPGLICSECGHDAGRERRLFKARRWRGRMVLGLLLLVAARAAYIAPRIVARGWIAAIPPWALILRFEGATFGGLPDTLTRTESQAILTELSSRALSGEIFWWDRWWIGKRILGDMDLNNSIKMRDAIVANLPLGITLDKELPRAFVPGLRTRVTPVSGFANNNSVDFGGLSHEAQEPGSTRGGAVLPVPLADSTEATIDIALVDLLGNTWATQRVTRPTHYVKSVNDVMTPAKEPVFSTLILRFSAVPSGVAVHVNSRPMFGGLPSTVSVGLHLDFRYKNESRASLDRAVGTDLSYVFRLRCCADPIIVPLGTVAPDDTGWTVVIQGNPGLAYVDPVATEYWGGTKTVRLADVLDREWVDVTYEPTKAP